jgi:anti-sigma B factor antagonist
MNIKTKKIQDILVIYPEEQNLDSEVSNEFRERIKSLVSEGHRRLIINLNTVDFIDSSGLGALVLGHKEVRKNGELKIAAPKPQIHEMMKLVRLDQVLNVYASEEAALASFN